VSLLPLDRDLVRDCLQGDEAAWRIFCDRFAGLISQVVEQSALLFQMDVDEPTKIEIVTEVFSSIFDRDFTVLRRFAGESSLATYLTVVARRIVVKRLQEMKGLGSKSSSELPHLSGSTAGSTAGMILRADRHPSNSHAVPAPSPVSPVDPLEPKPKA